MLFLNLQVRQDFWAIVDDERPVLVAEELKLSVHFAHRTLALYVDLAEEALGRHQSTRKNSLFEALARRSSSPTIMQQTNLHVHGGILIALAHH